MDSLIQNKIQEYLKVFQASKANTMNQLVLWAFSQNKSSDLYILAKILNSDQLSELISYFDGASLKIPTHKEYQETLILVLVFFLKEIHNMNWEDIKKFLDFPPNFNVAVNTKSMGRRLVALKEQLHTRILELVKEMDIKDAESLMKVISEEDKKEFIEKIVAEDKKDFESGRKAKNE